LIRHLALLLIPFSGFAQTIAITTGVVDHQVFQRDGQERATLKLTGTASGAEGKAVEARVVANVVPVAAIGHSQLTWKGGSKWKAIGKVEGTSWSADLTLTAGGPYRIELRAGGGQPLAVEDVLVGDLWVLAGQSNMEGVGNLQDVQQPNPLIHSFDQTDHWDVAREPLHRLPDAADRVHWRRNPQTKEPEKLEGEALKQFIEGRKKGAGLGLPFAAEMLQRTGIPVGLLPCAHGGTSMDQWDPALKSQGGDSLYGATLRRVNVAGGKVKGILWYQGESDTSPQAAPEFLTKFEKLVAAFREDFGQPDLPFYYVQIGRFVNTSNMTDWNSVQQSQLLAESRIPKSGMVVSIDSILDDAIHVSTPDLKRLGKRMANLACHDLFPGVAQCAGLKPGPRPQAANFEGDGLIRVTFAGVNGALQSEGRLSGFSLHDSAGAYVPALYKTLVDPKDSSAVLLYYGGKLPDGASLRYGSGKDPYCNLTDAAGMGAPVFGPMPIAAK
jgi:sialate O-acetylesterase